MLRAVVELAERDGLHIHLFGVSTPPILYLFHQLGISSFDSLAWMRAAAYGNVFLPFMRGYMVTYRVVRRTHTYQEQFEHLKQLTGHQCMFCDDFSLLMTNRMYRIMHNLVSVLDTLDLLRSGKLNHAQIMQILAAGSPSYLRYYEVNDKT